MNKNKKYSITILAIVGILIFAVSALTIFVDPYFHYHAPNKKFDYVLNNERYKNDGIARHFEYNAIITGTSMTQNFKASEFNSLFGVNSIKVSSSGSTFKERYDLLNSAISYNKDIKIILNSLDFGLLSWLQPYDSMRYDNYPTYLYDSNIFNDVEYLLNKSVFFNETMHTIKSTNEGGLITSFDNYSNWNGRYKFSKEIVLKSYNRKKQKSISTKLSDKEKEFIKEMLDLNIIKLAKNHPDITFYYFMPPYSIIWWDDVIQSGNLDKLFEMIEYIYSNITDIKNIKLFNYADQFDIVTNLDNYKDSTHYSEKWNSYILQSISKGENLITKNNYKEDIICMREFYSNYDYEQLFK